MKVGLVGLGYVGLPLALAFSRAGAEVLGVDSDPGKIERLRAGESYIGHIDSARVAEAVLGGRLTPSSDFAVLAAADAILICVPTPLGTHREPDLSFVTGTARQLAPHLRRGVLVVLESTTYPGTTEEVLLPMLESGSGLKAGIDFHLAYSPEREDPGNPESRLSAIPKVVGGLTPVCLERALAVYRLVVSETVPVSSCRAAEATKLLENIFRCVNIALVNELKVVYAAMGIDVWEVIAAARTKPFGFMPFYPGPGLGGHCIPIDPFYLTWKAREYDQDTRFIELAGEINRSMPQYVIGRVAEALGERHKAVRGSRVLVLGLAYKPGVDDDRESPSYVLMDLLRASGADVAYYDPYVPAIKPTRRHAHWAGTRSISWDRDTVAGFDLALIATKHAGVNYHELAAWVPLIVDTRDAMAGVPVAPGVLWKA